MKARIHIDQEKALKIGNNQSGTIEIDFDPADLTQGQRNELANDWAWEAGRGKVFKAGIAGIADLETLKKLIDERIANREKNNAEKKVKAEQDATKIDAAVLKWIKLPLSKRIIGKGLPLEYVIDPSLMPYVYGTTDMENLTKYAETHPKAATAIAEAKAEAKRLTAEAKRKYEETATRNKAIRIKREAEEKAAAEQRSIQITTWVENNGTPSQKDRLKENLLPRAEIVDLIRDEAFAKIPLQKTDAWGNKDKGMVRYEKLKASDICTCEYDYCDCSYDVSTKTSATPEVYEILQEIRKLMPDATVELRDHEGKSDDCENIVTRTGIMVRVTVGAFKFSREYGIPMDE